MKHSLPPFFKPLVWSLRWDHINTEDDKGDIIVNTMNEGTLAHVRWIIKRYGRATIHDVLEHRLASELHPESRHFARVLFGVQRFHHARRSTHRTRQRTLPSPR